MITVRVTAFCCLFLLAGCAAPIRNLTRTAYVQPDFSADSLKAGGLALFPVTAGREQEGYRRPLGDCLNQWLQAAVPGGHVVGWQATMDSLNTWDAVGVFHDMIAQYRETSIIDRRKVQRIADAVQVRYGLLCSLQDYSQRTETHYTIFGANTTVTSNVQAHCLVLDLETGDIAQEIIGHAQSIGALLNARSPYQAYAEVVASSVLSQVPGSTIVFKVPEKPKVERTLRGTVLDD